MNLSTADAGLNFIWLFAGGRHQDAASLSGVNHLRRWWYRDVVKCCNAGSRDRNQQPVWLPSALLRIRTQILNIRDNAYLAAQRISHWSTYWLWSVTSVKPRGDSDEDYKTSGLTAQRGLNPPHAWRCLANAHVIFIARGGFLIHTGRSVMYNPEEAIHGWCNNLKIRCRNAFSNWLIQLNNTSFFSRFCSARISIQRLTKSTPVQEEGVFAIIFFLLNFYFF